MFKQRETLINSRLESMHGKPMFPNIDNVNARDLGYFINSSSWFFFNLFNIDKTFLNVPINAWESEEFYIQAKETVTHLQVVNG